MKIIKRGVPPNEKIWTGTCYRCASIVSAKQSELTITQDQRDRTFAKAKCPVCNSLMSFNEDVK